MKSWHWRALVAAVNLVIGLWCVFQPLFPGAFILGVVSLVGSAVMAVLAVGSYLGKPP